MRKQFVLRRRPSTFRQVDVLDANGDLRQDIFDRACSHLNSKSSPGFPYSKYATNADVPASELYMDVNDMLKRWLSIELPNELEYSDEQKLWFFNKGLAPPAQIFVKSEPTKSDKVARIIYGLSSVMNVIARILFADYLQSVNETWGVCSHKVGMDMYTSAGLKTLNQNFQTIFNTVPNSEVISDDVQGWEYMDRPEFQRIWHEIYMEQANATPFHRRLQTVYACVERAMLVIDSDSYVHSIPFYITFSGKVTTHLQNSDERAALAEVDYGTYNTLLQTTVTNGDDCLAARPKGSKPEFSTSLGFIHTDEVVQKQNHLNFSSQHFITSQGSDETIRIPDGVHKAVYNLLCGPNDESYRGIMTHLENFKGRPSIERLHGLAESRFKPIDLPSVKKVKTTQPSASF